MKKAVIADIRDMYAPNAAGFNDMRVGCNIPDAKG